MTDRALFLSYDLFSTGGIQRLSRHATNALAAGLPPDGLDVCSLQPQTDGGFASERPVAVVGSGSSLGSRRRFAADVRRLARSRRPSLVVCDHIRLAPLTRAVARAVDASYAVVVHGIEVWSPMPLWRRRALLGADAILSVSRFTEHHLASRYPSLASRLTVVGGCANCEEFVPGAADVEGRAEFGRDPVVLTVSRLAPGRPKGHERVFEAMAELRTAGLRFTYLIAGDGPDRRRLEAMAERVGLRESVVFIGNVPDADLPALYRLCDVFVLVSGFRMGWRPQGEALGLVSLEAQACGRPIITSRLDGSAEAIADGETGLLVDPHDPQEIAEVLRTILGDAERRERMGAAARRLAVDRFSVDAFSKRLRAALAPWLSNEPASVHSPPASIMQ